LEQEPEAIDLLGFLNFFFLTTKINYITKP